ncbi:hypothetical protein A9Q86_04820 [Flavobacteriales bacterium 33_180_T64]|nr:hypothetical protein A9Q86_04820 [Flavobacteriales bacterium 33_180_T64]
MKIEAIELFGKTLLSKVTIEEPIEMPTPMPEDEAAFVYILKGCCINYSETDELKLQANQAVLAKCGNNTFKTIPVNGSSTYSAISIRFHKDILERIYHNSASPFFKNTTTPLTVNSVTVETNALITAYINTLNFYFDHQDLVTEDLLILKLKELITLVLQTENAPKVLEIMTNLFEKKTFEFKEIIKAHICSSVTIKELAQLTNHSLSAFKKEFKRVYKDTPNNYMINQRIEKVAELLPTSNETISHIAYDCEFKTLAHLSRVFKAKYGITPSEYRLNFSGKK